VAPFPPIQRRGPPIPTDGPRNFPRENRQTRSGQGGFPRENRVQVQNTGPWPAANPVQTRGPVVGVFIYLFSISRKRYVLLS
jgi:hypothetical protein